MHFGTDLPMRAPFLELHVMRECAVQIPINDAEELKHSLVCDIISKANQSLELSLSLGLGYGYMLRSCSMHP